MTIKQLSKRERQAVFEPCEIFASDALPLADSPDALPMEVPVLKYGVTKYTKGGEVGEYSVSEADADSIIAEFSTRGKDLVVDWEHQTRSGNRAPAAGWVKSLEKTADGLVAKLNYWTSDGAKDLATRAYRYFPPVINFSRSGKSLSSLHSIALTNHPATHGIPALVCADGDAGDEEFDDQIDEPNTQGNHNMNEIYKALGITEDTPEAERESKAKARIEELTKAQAAVTALSDTVAKMERESSLAKAEAAVSLALSDSKVAEANKQWALDFAAKDPAGFQAWLNAAPSLKVAPPLTLSDMASAAAPIASKPLELSDSDERVKICKQFNRTPEEIKTIIGAI